MRDPRSFQRPNGNPKSARFPNMEKTVMKVRDFVCDTRTEHTARFEFPAIVWPGELFSERGCADRSFPVVVICPGKYFACTVCASRNLGWGNLRVTLGLGNLMCQKKKCWKASSETPETTVFCRCYKYPNTPSQVCSSCCLVITIAVATPEIISYREGYNTVPLVHTYPGSCSASRHEGIWEHMLFGL